MTMLDQYRVKVFSDHSDQFVIHSVVARTEKDARIIAFILDDNTLSTKHGQNAMLDNFRYRQALFYTQVIPDE